MRAARPEDVPRLAAIARAAYRPYVERIGREPPPMNQDFAADWPDTVVIGTPEAYVVRRIEPARVLLENVAVHPEAAGRGLGRELIAHVEAEACRLSLPVELYTNSAMHENLALYPRLGYGETARVTEHGLHRVYFRKQP